MMEEHFELLIDGERSPIGNEKSEAPRTDILKPESPSKIWRRRSCRKCSRSSYGSSEAGDPKKNVKPEILQKNKKFYPVYNTWYTRCAAGDLYSIRSRRSYTEHEAGDLIQNIEPEIPYKLWIKPEIICATWSRRVLQYIKRKRRKSSRNSEAGDPIEDAKPEILYKILMRPEILYTILTRRPNRKRWGGNPSQSLEP